MMSVQTKRPVTRRLSASNKGNKVFINGAMNSSNPNGHNHHQIDVTLDSSSSKFNFKLLGRHQKKVVNGNVSLVTTESNTSLLSHKDKPFEEIVEQVKKTICKSSKDGRRRPRADLSNHDLIKISHKSLRNGKLLSCQSLRKSSVKKKIPSVGEGTESKDISPQEVSVQNSNARLKKYCKTKDDCIVEEDESEQIDKKRVEFLRNTEETLSRNRMMLQQLSKQHQLLPPLDRSPESSGPSTSNLKRQLDSDCSLSSKKSLLDDDLSGESSRLRRRSQFKSYHSHRCPTRGCDSKGHLLGKYVRHYTSKTCPLLHSRELENKNKIKQRNRSSQQHANITENPYQISERQLQTTLDQISDQETILRENKEIQKQSTRQGEVKTPTPPSPPAPLSPSLQPLASTSKRRSKYLNQAEYKQVISSGITPEEVETYEQAKDTAVRNFREEMRKAGIPCNNQKRQSQANRKPVRKIQLGRYVLDCWGPSKYVEDYIKSWKLYICQYCLKYMNSKPLLARHRTKCDQPCPPGNEIYRNNNISIFEVDGAVCKMYCQNLCLLAMLFIESKTVYLETEPFLFYVMTDRTHDNGQQLVGYFSKEKNSFLGYNLSCILVLPHYLGAGYGRMLIDVSYHLSKRDGKYGSPEHPLSQHGQLAYNKYWRHALLRALAKRRRNEADSKMSTLTIRWLCDETAMTPQDVVETLKVAGMADISTEGRLTIKLNLRLIDEWRERQAGLCQKRLIKADCFSWNQKQ